MRVINMNQAQFLILERLRYEVCRNICLVSIKGELVGVIPV